MADPTGGGVQGYVTSTPPRSPRAASLSNLTFQSGFVSNGSGRSIVGRFKDGNRVRFNKGLPEKIKGWVAQNLTGANGGIYMGTGRGLFDWASLDDEEWIAIGTECKLYIINRGTLYDITPIRATSNTLNAFTTTNTSRNINVNDVNHRAATGDHITVLGPITLGGIVINGPYTITAVIDPSNYTIQAATPATSSAGPGGGAISIQYDIACGLAINGEIYGYGTGRYGMGTYGTPRPTNDGVQARMRIWSLQNWGEDLVASYTDGEIYWWDKTTGPNSRAQLLVNAPTSVQRIVVNADLQYLIALGASDVGTGIADKMNVRWCSESDLQDWIPVELPVENTAGGQRLNFGNRMVTGLMSNNTLLAWSDTQLYQMQFVGLPNVFGFFEKGKCYIVGPNAAVDVNGVAYFMGFDDFYAYDGQLRILPCDVWEHVFGVTGTESWAFDRTQSDSTYCSSYFSKSEVTWFYLRNDGEVGYVTLNYGENCWYYGLMERTAYHDVSPAMTGYFETPYAINDGILYQHEIGLDEVEPGTTNAMDYFLESWDIGSQSDKPVLINSIVPDFPIVEGELALIKGLQFYLIPREYPNQPDNDTADGFPRKGPFVVVPSTNKQDVRALGTQTALRIEAARATWTGEPGGGGTHTNAIVFGQWWRMGLWQALATPYGRRIGGSTQNEPIDTSG